MPATAERPCPHGRPVAACQACVIEAANLSAARAFHSKLKAQHAAGLGPPVEFEAHTLLELDLFSIRALFDLYELEVPKPAPVPSRSRWPNRQ